MVLKKREIKKPQTTGTSNFLHFLNASESTMLFYGHPVVNFQALGFLDIMKSVSKSKPFPLQGPEQPRWAIGESNSIPPLSSLRDEWGYNMKFGDPKRLTSTFRSGIFKKFTFFDLTSDIL